MADDRNPFADPLRFERRAPECAMAIFGANGDLAKRKLMPALYRLAYDGRLPASFAVIGTSRTAFTDEAFREMMRGAVQEEDTAFDEDLWKRFAQNLYYVAGDMHDSTLYQALGAKLRETGQKNVLFYLATQPSYYGMAADCLRESGLRRLLPTSTLRVD